VVHRYVLRGTHEEEFMGIPPTGNRVEVHGIDELRVFDGKIVERWGQVDQLGLMQQLGVIPPPEQAGA
jgi:predicted ester cyclase